MQKIQKNSKILPGETDLFLMFEFEEKLFWKGLLLLSSSESEEDMLMLTVDLAFLNYVFFLNFSFDRMTNKQHLLFGQDSIFIDM